MHHHVLLIFLLLILLLLINTTDGGHEVVHGIVLKADDIKPNELCVIQYDSRPLVNGNYWTTAAQWNQAYTKKYGHHYKFLSTHDSDCFYASQKLSTVWCKVKAMNVANSLLPSNIKAVLYLDSDAVITTNHSMTDVLAYMRKYLHWDYRQRPFAFNQDGPGWACKYTMANTPYQYCLNSGTVFWLKSDVATDILHDWWHSAGDPYDRSTYPTKWKTKWPWEQAQMYKVNDKHQDHIIKLSFPAEPFLPWTSKKNPKSQYPTDYVEPWCFSHWPGANCFITHHCASKRQKDRLIEYYNASVYDEVVIPAMYIDEQNVV